MEGENWKMNLKNGKIDDQVAIMAENWMSKRFAARAVRWLVTQSIIEFAFRSLLRGGI